MQLKKPGFFLVLIFLLLLSSCSKRNEEDFIYLNSSFQWMPVTEDASLEFAENHPQNFEPFTAFGDKQIYKLTKNKYPYIWLKAEFTIPSNLKNEKLGLVMSYLHFADEVYLNGKFIGKDGRFPPKELSTFYSAHYYNIPSEFLNQEVNTLFIKVCQKGASGISKNIFITKEAEAESIYKNWDFLHSKMYMFYEGGLFCTAILCIFLFIATKKRKYFTFAMMNFWIIVLITPFFAYNVPYYASSDIPFLFFMKVTLCCGTYFAFFYGISFTADYMEITLSRKVKIIQHLFLISEILCTVFIKDYNKLMKISPLMMTFLGIQLF